MWFARTFESASEKRADSRSFSLNHQTARRAKTIDTQTHTPNDRICTHTYTQRHTYSCYLSLHFLFPSTRNIYIYNIYEHNCDAEFGLYSSTLIYNCIYTIGIGVKRTAVESEAIFTGVLLVCAFINEGVSPANHINRRANWNFLLRFFFCLVQTSDWTYGLFI